MKWSNIINHNHIPKTSLVLSLSMRTLTIYADQFMDDDHISNTDPYEAGTFEITKDGEWKFMLYDRPDITFRVLTPELRLPSID